MPLYYPGFWARLTVDPARRKIKLQITKTFGERQTILSRIVSEHYGVPAEERKIIPIAPFTIREGAELDLSAHYKEIVQTPTERAVLPTRRACSVPDRRYRSSDRPIAKPRQAGEDRRLENRKAKCEPQPGISANANRQKRKPQPDKKGCRESEKIPRSCERGIFYSTISEPPIWFRAARQGVLPEFRSPSSCCRGNA